MFAGTCKMSLVKYMFVRWLNEKRFLNKPDFTCFSNNVCKFIWPRPYIEFAGK